MEKPATKNKAYVLWEDMGRSNSGLTRIFHAYSNAHNVYLGVLHWYAPWRRYIFQPAPNTIFDAACLNAITRKLEKEMQEHKRNTEPRKAMSQAQGI